MHSGSQISNDMRTNVTFTRNTEEEIIDSRPQFKYGCNRCKKRIGTNKYSHEKHLNECFLNKGLKNGIDFIECALCKFVGIQITNHVKKYHNLTKEKYNKLYGSTVATESVKIRSNTNKINGNWITRANEEGKDLTEYKKKMGKAVSESIMASPSARLARSKKLTEVNQRQETRERSSRIAKITSTRPEIIAERTKRLNDWRLSHKEEFYENFVNSILKVKISRPENFLYKLLKEHEQTFGLTFKRQQIVKSNVYFSMNKSRRKSVDIADIENKIFIEFDGPYHFRKFKKDQNLELTQEKDKAFEKYIIENGYTLIRVGYDVSKTKVKSIDKKQSFYVIFNEKVIESIFEILSKRTVGIFKFGVVYE